MDTTTESTGVAETPAAMDAVLNEMSPEEREILRERLNQDAHDRAGELADQLNQTPTKLNLPDSADSIPAWVIRPPGLVCPKYKQVIYIRFKSSMTDTPNKGERQCILWSNNIGDQKLAINRADRDPNRMHEMLVKQMIRAIDGQIVDISDPNSPAAIEPWYDAIGPKCRSILDKVYFQLHTASREEAVDFFEDCIAVRVGGG